MSNEYRAKVFKSGNSVALRLPKGMGIPEGTDMRMVEGETPMSFQAEPFDTPKRKFNVDAIWGIAAGSGLQPRTPAERVFEHRPLLWDDPAWLAGVEKDE